MILENHLHLIATSSQLSKDMARFKSFTARQIINFLKERKAERVLSQLGYYKLRHKLDRDYQLWQEGSHPQQILDVEMMRQKVGYIHYNPVRRGFVDEMVHWRYSSARNYMGQEGLIAVETDWSRVRGRGASGLHSHAERGDE